MQPAPIREIIEKELPLAELQHAKQIRANALNADEQDGSNNDLSRIIRQQVSETVIATNMLIDAALGGIGSDEERNITGGDANYPLLADRADERLADENYLLSVLESAYENGDISVDPQDMLDDVIVEARDRGYRIAAAVRKIKA